MLDKYENLISNMTTENDSLLRSPSPINVDALALATCMIEKCMTDHYIV